MIIMQDIKYVKYFILLQTLEKSSIFLLVKQSVNKLNQLQTIPSGKVNGHHELIKLRLAQTKNMCTKLNLAVSILYFI